MEMCKKVKIDSELIKRKLSDRNISEVAKGAELSAQTLYNFLAGRKMLGGNSTNKLVNYFLNNG